MGVVVETKLKESRESSGIQARHWMLMCGFLMAAIVLYLGVDAVFDRNFRKNITDGVAYLDISHALASGHPEALLNPYWSPGYPVTLAAGLAILHPSPARELAAVYLIHWAIGILALLGLVYFVSGLPVPAQTGRTFGLTRPMLLALGCALFLVALQADVPIYLMTPDVLLAALLWLAGGTFLRIARGQRIYHYALLAVALSLAYFTKAVALSLALAALPILPFAGPDRRRAARGLLVYVATAAILISPYVAKLSAAKGHFTLGESGGLNYAWIVDGSDGPNRWHMQNDSPAGHARLHLVHPARRLWKSPDVYEFATPVQGTFPIFDDPSYWDDGLKPAFYWKGQLWHIAMNAYHTVSWFQRRGEFVVALLLLFLAQRHFRMRARLREVFPVLLWFASLWGVYLLVDVEDRYVFAILTAVLLLAAAAIRLPDSGNLQKVVAACTIILACGAVIRSIDTAGGKFYTGIKSMYIGPVKAKAVGPYDNPYWEVAQTLTNKLGLRPNDQVACMHLGCDNTYWAPLAGLRVTADVSRDVNYWESSPADRAQAMSVLAAAGIKAVVTENLGAGAESEGWVALSDPREIPGQGLYARLTK